MIVIDMNSVVDGVASDRKSLTVALVNPTQSLSPLTYILKAFNWPAEHRCGK